MLLPQRRRTAEARTSPRHILAAKQLPPPRREAASAEEREPARRSPTPPSSCRANSRRHDSSARQQRTSAAAAAPPASQRSAVAAGRSAPSLPWHGRPEPDSRTVTRLRGEALTPRACRERASRPATARACHAVLVARMYCACGSLVRACVFIAQPQPELLRDIKVLLERCEAGLFSQSRMLAAARRGASASPHGPGMHPHTLLFRMPMRSVDAVVVLQLCSAATAPVSRVAAFGPAAPASSAARRRGGTRALRIPSEGRRLERWSRASRQTRRRHPYPRPHP